jgi:hypothetical protein
VGVEDKSFGSITARNDLNTQISIVCSGETLYQGVSFATVTFYSCNIKFLLHFCVKLYFEKTYFAEVRYIRHLLLHPGFKEGGVLLL